MALVAYSDSEDDEPVIKRHRTSDDDNAPPPLPASFLNLYSSSVRLSNTDDPSLHAGRKRAVKHVEGNWPTHIYLECKFSPLSLFIESLLLTYSPGLPSPAEHDTLTHLLTALPDTAALHSLLQTPLHVPLPLHISLSAPLVLRTETKDAFLDTLTSQLSPLLRSPRDLLTLHPSSLSWHGNQHSNRYFLVLRLKDTQENPGALTLLNRLLIATNRVARQFGQPQLYTSPSTSKPQDGDEEKDFSSCFHISIAWALPSPDLEFDHAVPETDEVVRAALKNVCDMTVPFDAVKIRIGQTVTALPIGTSLSRSKRPLVKIE